MDFFLLVLDPQHFIGVLEVGLNKVFVALSRIVGEYDELGFRPTMSACSRLIQSPQSQGADMASPVIARGNGIVDHRRSTYKADFSFNVILGPIHIRLLVFIALLRFGIFGRAFTKAASTAKTWRWWCGRC